MKSLKYIYAIVLCLLTFPSCQKMEDFELSSTVFIEDPYNPGLPIYSEWGYNTFGAYIDRKAFISTQNDIPAKIIINGDTLHLIFRGQMLSQKVDLKISIKGYSPADYFDLVELNGKTFNLKDSGNSATLKIDNHTTILNIIEGKLELKRVQKLYVDEDPSRAILSGYFNLKTFLNGEPIAISAGRFDLGIGYENFYNFK